MPTGIKSTILIALTPATPERIVTNNAEATVHPRFVSASARTFTTALTPPVLQIAYTPTGGPEKIFDIVTLWSAHTWWADSGQQCFPDVAPGEKVRFTLISAPAAVDLRFDTVEV